MSSGPSIRGSLDTESDMLPQDPPPFIIRWTAWLLLAFLGVALLLSIFLKLPETVRCPFVLVPATGADSIQSPRQGMIVKAVTEGQKVTKDSALFVLRSDEVRGWETSSHTLGEDLKSITQSLAQFDAAYDAQFQIQKGVKSSRRAAKLVFAKITHAPAATSLTGWRNWRKRAANRKWSSLNCGSTSLDRKKT